ncbi:STE/STE20/PAKA protein kinase [Mycena floridula]|nr:STE/STE20/PAKA protein kinase [Mycena floridula]
MASSSNNNPSKSATSRFSTLKVFKFGKQDRLPPPLPPKDPVYLSTRSLSSLSPVDSFAPSQPNSPLSPYQYQRGLDHLPVTNASSMSLASSSASVSPQAKKDKVSGFFRFGKRSPRSPSIKSNQADSPPAGDDENISLPLNFQHNIHVDEGFAGLPPSWTASLVEHGFSEEEIAAIQARRAAGTRSPGSNYLYNDRPRSPASVTTSSSYQSPAPILTRPNTRTTSLPRQYSDNSLRNGSVGSSPSQTSLHSMTPQKTRKSPPVVHSRMDSSSSLSLSISLESDKELPDVVVDSGLSPIHTASTSGAEVGSPSTPPKRFHVANGPISPPPSYSKSIFSSTNGGYHADKKEPSASASRKEAVPAASGSKPTRPQHRQLPSTDSLTSVSSKKSTDRRRSKRFTALPPRLSLHKDDSTDLSLWSEALISAIPSELSSSSREPTPSSSTFSKSEWSPPLNKSSPGASRSSPLVVDIKSSRKGVVPPQIITEDDNDVDVEISSSRAEAATSAGVDLWVRNNLSNMETRSPRSPLWEEIEGLVAGDRPEAYDGPALSETYSPTLPITPGLTVVPAAPPRNRVSAYQIKDKGEKVPQITSGWADDEDDDEYEEEDATFLSAGNATNRNSSRSSTSTVSTVTVTSVTAAVVRRGSIARRAVANVIDQSKPLRQQIQQQKIELDELRSSRPASLDVAEALKPPVSPQSSHFGSSEGSSGGSGSSSSQSQDHQTPTTEIETESSLMYYLDSPDPNELEFKPDDRHRMMVSATDTFGGILKAEDLAEEQEEEQYDEEEDFEDAQVVNVVPVPKPTIIINEAMGMHTGPLTALNSSTTPNTPAPRYRGWVSNVVRPLEEFIDETVDPHDYYLDLKEIAEGESGSVFVARMTEDKPLHKLKLPPLTKAQDTDNQVNGVQNLVAIKVVGLVPSGSPKINDVRHELTLLKGLMHVNLLNMDALYVDLSDDSLWIRMELMERSLADVISLIEEGLILQDRTIARFANDVLSALQYLQSHRIAHRDVRSDNLLLNSAGVLKLTDFSNAVKVSKDSLMSNDIVGVPYWQAPEMRRGSYNVMKVDVWSLGATVWEMAQAEPPFASSEKFADRWPPLSQPELFPPSFHEFLRLCSEPAASRPDPETLAKNAFVNNCCGRLVVVQLLSQCMAIEEMLQGEEEDGQEADS